MGNHQRAHHYACAVFSYVPKMVRTQQYARRSIAEEEPAVYTT